MCVYVYVCMYVCKYVYVCMYGCIKIWTTSQKLQNLNHHLRLMSLRKVIKHAHDHNIPSVDFSPNGLRLASAGIDKTVSEILNGSYLIRYMLCCMYVVRYVCMCY